MPEQQITASTPAGVTVANVFVANGDFARATAIAQEECQRFGRDAARVPDDTQDGIVYFNCVD
jgi:hypothetical protein